MRSSGKRTPKGSGCSAKPACSVSWRGMVGPCPGGARRRTRATRREKGRRIRGRATCVRGALRAFLLPAGAGGGGSDHHPASTRSMRAGAACWYLEHRYYSGFAFSDGSEGRRPAAGTHAGDEQGAFPGTDRKAFSKVLGRGGGPTRRDVSAEAPVLTAPHAPFRDRVGGVVHGTSPVGGGAIGRGTAAGRGGAAAGGAAAAGATARARTSSRSCPGKPRTRSSIFPAGAALGCPVGRKVSPRMKAPARPMRACTCSGAGGWSSAGPTRTTTTEASHTSSRAGQVRPSGLTTAPTSRRARARPRAGPGAGRARSRGRPWGWSRARSPCGPRRPPR